MTEFNNENRGSAWLSKQKYPDGPRTQGAVKGKGKPDYNGSINVMGQDFYFDMWLRPEDSTNPKAPAFTFKVKPKDAVPEGHPDRFRERPNGLPQKPTNSGPMIEDDLPF